MHRFFSFFHSVLCAGLQLALSAKIDRSACLLASSPTFCTAWRVGEAGRAWPWAEAIADHCDAAARWQYVHYLLDEVKHVEGDARADARENGYLLRFDDAIIESDNKAAKAHARRVYNGGDNSQQMLPRHGPLQEDRRWLREADLAAEEQPGKFFY